MAYRGVAAAVVAVIGMSAGLAAQRPAAPRSPFASAKTLQCSFTTYAATEWRDGVLPVSTKEDLSFQIEIVNLKKGRAKVVGNNGSADATVMLGETGLNVIEQTPIGNFILTTIFAAGGDAGRFLAVHARHIGDPNDPPSPSQHYGSCTIAK
jgi:hypothetical protein